MSTDSIENFDKYKEWTDRLNASTGAFKISDEVMATIINHNFLHTIDRLGLSFDDILATEIQGECSRENYCLKDRDITNNT